MFWKNRTVLVSSVVALLTGCASQIMQGYVGKDVREVMLDYGAPANAFDMGDGRRAFQWVIGSSYTTPVSAKTTGNVNAIGSTGYDGYSKRAQFLASKLTGSDRLLIVDDAHKLTRPALQWLFDFTDETQTPLGLIGTLELLDKIEDDAQRFSRVGLCYEIVPESPQELITHLIKTHAPSANGAAGELADLCEQVVVQHGHYRAVNKQLKLAAELKEHARKPITWPEAFRQAHTKLVRKYKLA